jgi:hypothetical protein
MSVGSIGRFGRKVGEKRKESRSQLSLTGRLFFPDRNVEDICQIVDFSPSGARLKSSASSPVGAQIVLYMEEFGRYEGLVVWRDRTLLGMQFRCSESRRARTSEQLAIFLANGGKRGLDLRRSARIHEMPNLSEVVTSRGEHLPCEVIDIALGGAALRSSIRPEIGEMVQFGECTARVIRHSPNGFVVEFFTLSSGSI